MDCRYPTGISKAAADRRRKNQLPRKRPTGTLASRGAACGVAYPVQTPKSKVTSNDATRSKKPPTCVKTASNKPNASKGTPIVLERGDDRIGVPGYKDPQQKPIRRIVASRRKLNDSSILEYKVQWETTWEEAATMKRSAVEDWKHALADDQVFIYTAQDGSKWKVLKDSHELENDSDEMQWDMWRAIRRNAIEEFQRDWFARMKEIDFVYANEHEESRAMYTAEKYGLKKPTSALEAIRTAWNNLRIDRQLLDPEITYGDVKIRFIDEVDPASISDSETLDWTQRPPRTIVDTIRPTLSNPLAGLHENTFSQDRGTYENCKHWREVMQSLIRTAPFMFKTGTWMQLLALLILGGAILKTELAAVGIHVQDDWPHRAREYDMHMYYDRIVDDRPIHEIQETFLHLREFFRELEPDVEREEVQAMDSVTERTNGEYESQFAHGTTNDIHTECGAVENQGSTPSGPATRLSVSSIPLVRLENEGVRYPESASWTPSTPRPEPRVYNNTIFPVPAPSLEDLRISPRRPTTDRYRGWTSLQKEREELHKRIDQLAQQKAFQEMTETDIRKRQISSNSRYIGKIDDDSLDQSMEDGYAQDLKRARYA